MPPLTLDGTNGVSAVQAGAVESGDLPAGSVVQVKHTVVVPNISSNSGSPISLGLSTSITPNSTNNSFLLIATIQANHNVHNSGYGLVLYRDNSDITTTQKYEILVQTDENSRHKSTFQFLDNPNTTSTITYDTRPKMNSNNVMTFGENLFDCNLTLMEIAG